MGNQQPSTLWTLGINAKFGDGSLWKHPECINAKVVYSSTTPELLEVKRSIEPSIFTTGIRSLDTSKMKGRFPNAKPMYYLASIVDPVFTELKTTPKEQLFSKLTLEDFGLWYLDDGSTLRRSDSHSYRFMISIGDCCSTVEKQILFESSLHKLFGLNHGTIRLNNSKATNNNKTWHIPISVAYLILNEASKYGVLDYKVKVQRPSRRGVEA